MKSELKYIIPFPMTEPVEQIEVGRLPSAPGSRESDPAVPAFRASIPSAMMTRVAKAMMCHEHRAAFEELQAVWSSDQPYWEAHARVAIAEMREPDEAMVNHAWQYIGSNLRHEEVYRHLIDAALNPGIVEEYTAWLERGRGGVA